MEETDQHKPLLLESQEDAVVEQASIEEDKQRSGLKKSWFGLIAFFSIATVVVVFHRFNTSPGCRSKMELMANVVMPGVDISNLNETAPQYHALEWLACQDLRHDDDATELLERFSLVTFYYLIGGDSLPEFYNEWLTISSHCDWRGLYCDEDGRVTAWIIKLPCIGDDTRTLPTEIGNLKRLRQLEVDEYSSMVGPIPSEIGHLQQLESLGLSYNNFMGPIPSEIGHLQQLETLDLFANKFLGPIPSEIGHLQQLKSLSLVGNMFSGPIPSEIGNLQQLKSLFLEQNKLSGPIPSEIGNLQQLNVVRPRQERQTLP
eukprot:scaffold4410_cov78-Cylindrotheca_fusiformis.AAC.2